nr:MAG TPA: hypothetical protein [Bacteriophage sp.]
MDNSCRMEKDRRCMETNLRKNRTGRWEAH